jgi:GT2 family glycosyltransferase
MDLQGNNLGGAGGVDFGFRLSQDGVRYDTQSPPLFAFSWLSS